MIWAAIKHAVNSTLGTAQFKSIDKHITDATDRIYNAAVVKNGSVIKSIQRGTVLPAAGSSNTYITIATVTPSKCMVILTGGTVARAAVNYYGSHSIQNVRDITATQLSVYTVRESSDTAREFSWQVIEFY